MVRRIDGQSRHARNAHVRAFFRHLGRELVPMPPAIARPKQRSRPRAGENDRGVCRVEGHLPDMERVHRRVEPLELPAAVLAEVNAVIGAGQDRPRLSRMNREPEYAAFGPKAGPHLPPAFPAIGTDPGAGSDRPDANSEVTGHCRLLPKNSLTSASFP